jgi:hypothetical protein
MLRFLVAWDLVSSCSGDDGCVSGARVASGLGCHSPGSRNRRGHREHHGSHLRRNPLPHDSDWCADFHCRDDCCSSGCNVDYLCCEPWTFGTFEQGYRLASDQARK